MITVCIWLAKKANSQKNVGHAAMVVGGHTYISWWPDEAAGMGRDYHPIRNKSFDSDVRDEGGNPDYFIHLSGLDEKAILSWWEMFGLTRRGRELQGPLPPYNLLTQNCSTVVATGLTKGGGDKYAKWVDSWSVVWRPDTLLRYALSIKQGLGGK